MISKIPANEDRQFIIKMFLMDDTISIFELAKRNSGINETLQVRKSIRLKFEGELESGEMPL